MNLIGIGVEAETFPQARFVQIAEQISPKHAIVGLALVDPSGVAKGLTAVEFMKDGTEGETIASRLELVEVGTDEDGEAISSCVVVPSISRRNASSKRPKLSKSAQIAFKALQTAVIDAGEQPPASV